MNEKTAYEAFRLMLEGARCDLWDLAKEKAEVLKAHIERGVWPPEVYSKRRIRADLQWILTMVEEI